MLFYKKKKQWTIPVELGNAVSLRVINITNDLFYEYGPGN